MSQEVKTISLEAAASEIYQTCEGLPDSQLPYFFLVGAGVFKPPVKLASEIVDDCREVAKKYKRDIEPTDKSLVNAYSYWFSLEIGRAHVLTPGTSLFRMTSCA